MKYAYVIDDWTGCSFCVSNLYLQTASDRYIDTGATAEAVKLWNKN